MKRQVIILSVLFVLVGFSLKPCFADHIEKDKDRWKIFYKNITPNQTVKQWKVPFKTKNRTDLSTISIIRGEGTIICIWKPGRNLTITVQPVGPP